MEDAADEAATKPEEESNLDGFTPIDLSADMTELIKAAEEEAKAQQELDAVAQEVSDAVPDDSTAVEQEAKEEKTEEEVDCKATADAYLAQINLMQSDLDSAEALTTNMADSLAEIDPNMENGDEGKAFIRRMYKVRDQKAESKVAKMPETPLNCVTEVAGKVIMIENLQDDLDQAISFRDFFANVYCQAYVNSLVTMRDGLSQIFPGAFDGQIEDELLRIKAGFGEIILADLELNAVQMFMTSIESGKFAVDESSLLEAVQPVTEALALCGSDAEKQAQEALMDREDYLSDLNFLEFLMDY